VSAEQRSLSLAQLSSARIDLTLPIFDPIRFDTIPSRIRTRIRARIRSVYYFVAFLLSFNCCRLLQAL